MAMSRLCTVPIARKLCKLSYYVAAITVLPSLCQCTLQRLFGHHLHRPRRQPAPLIKERRGRMCWQHSNVEFRRSLDWTSARRPTLLTARSCGFPQPLQAKCQVKLGHWLVVPETFQLLFINHHIIRGYTAHIPAVKGDRRVRLTT
jgi:hypothetical protein